MSGVHVAYDLGVNWGLVGILVGASVLIAAIGYAAASLFKTTGIVDHIVLGLVWFGIAGVVVSAVLTFVVFPKESTDSSNDQLLSQVESHYHVQLYAPPDVLHNPFSDNHNDFSLNNVKFTDSHNTVYTGVLQTNIDGGDAEGTAHTTLLVHDNTQGKQSLVEYDTSD